MESFFSYFIGIAVAAFAVGGLILGFYLTSDAYAAQQTDDELSAMTAGDLHEIIRPLNVGRIPGDGPAKHRMLAALLKLGDESTDIQSRVDALSIGQEHALNEFGAASQISLLKLGDKALPPLKEMLTGDNLEKFSRACTSVNLIGEAAEPLVPTLLELASSDDELTSSLALFAFENMGQLAAPLIPLMKDTLMQREFHGQIYICRVCIGLGREAAPMAKPLEQLFIKGIPSSRSWAGIALGAIGPVEDVDTVKLLSSRIDAFTQIDKERALLALSVMGAEADAAKDAVYKSMMDKNSRVRPHAAYAYYKITDDADTPAGILAKLTKNRNQRSAALLQLSKMGAAGAIAIPEVELLLKSAEISEREAAVETLGSFGPKAARSRAKINQLSTDADPLLRQAVRESLDAIDGKTPVKSTAYQGSSHP